MAEPEDEKLKQVQRAAALFTRVGDQIYDDGIWTCKGGAAAFSYICHRMGIEHELRVGLYMWPSDELADKWALLEGGEPDEDDLDGYWRDEHHHWVEIKDPACIVDPNGEIRGVDRILLEDDDPSVYERYWDSQLPSDFLVYDPADPIEEIAKHDDDVARAIALVDAELGPKLSPVDAAPPAPKTAQPAVAPTLDTSAE